MKLWLHQPNGTTVLLGECPTGYDQAFGVETCEHGHIKNVRVGLPGAHGVRFEMELTLLDMQQLDEIVEKSISAELVKHGKVTVQ